MNIDFILFLFNRYAASQEPTELQIKNAWVDFNKNNTFSDLDRGY